MLRYLLVAIAAAAVTGMALQLAKTSNALNLAFQPIRYVPLSAPLDSLCQTTDTAMVRERGLDSITIAFAQGNGYFNWCVPEYDDDQRLHDAKAHSEDYGSIAHVLATPVLDQLVRSEQFDASYVQVALIAVEKPLTSDLAPYQDLGLGDRNCMYLHRRPSVLPRFLTSDQFDALIVPPDKSSHCPVNPATVESKPLDVAIEKSAFTGSSDVPPTTRFIEASDGRTLVGVKCGPSWCVVGPRGFRDVPPSAHEHVVGAPNGIPNGAQARVRGWYDDQKLGVLDGTAQFGIIRGARASAVPDAALGSLKVVDFMVPMNTQSYKIVGRVFFPDEPPRDSKYATVFGFSKGVNVVAMRAEAHPVSTLNPKPETVWYTQVTNSRGQVKNDILTDRMDHKAVFQAAGLPNPPATMRWRWFDSDEDLWVECDVGCCLAGIK